jgi:hypothetical protein
MAAVGNGGTARTAHAEDAVQPAFVIQPAYHVCQPGSHDAHGFVFVLAVRQYCQIAAPGCRHFAARNIGRKSRLADHAKIHHQGLQSLSMDQVAHEGKLPAFGIQCANQHNRFWHIDLLWNVLGNV